MGGLRPVGDPREGGHDDEQRAPLRRDKGGNVATPHAPVDGKVRPIAPFDSDNTNPAGGINSNADDMAKWLLVQLAEGQLADGHALIKPATARQLSTLVTPIPIGEGAPELNDLRPNFTGYGLGLGVRDYRGHKLLTHTGGLPGYVSKVAMIPDARLGIAILTNQESTAAFEAIADHIMDAISARRPRTGSPPTRRSRSAPRPRPHRRCSPPTPRATRLEAVAAARSLRRPYRDAWYGDMTIAAAGGGLDDQVRPTPLLTGTLEHWQHDTFVARWTDRELRADAFVTFALTPDGRSTP